MDSTGKNNEQLVYCYSRFVCSFTHDMAELHCQCHSGWHSCSWGVPLCANPRHGWVI